MLVFDAVHGLCCHPCSLSACLCLLECQRIVGKVSVVCLQDTLSFCDYLASGESMADATCRLQPLLGKQADLSQVSFCSGSLEIVYIKCTVHLSCIKQVLSRSTCASAIDVMTNKLDVESAVMLAGYRLVLLLCFWMHMQAHITWKLYRVVLQILSSLLIVTTFVC